MEFRSHRIHPKGLVQSRQMDEDCESQGSDETMNVAFGLRLIHNWEGKAVYKFPPTLEYVAV
eukprot:scaffold2979_cov405-Prasinococcus_capsulatus_cf.AAC.18